MSGGAPLRLVLASANPDKVAEIAAVLDDVLDVELVPRPAAVPDVVEDGATLLDNARLKARALVAATGLPAVADDTGLEVDALGGAPGVYSARYAGEGVTYADNVAKLLVDLDALPEAGGRGGPGSARSPWPHSPTDRSSRPKGWSRGRFRPGHGETAASATTRCSSPSKGAAAPSPRWPRPRSTPSRTADEPSARWRHS